MGTLQINITLGTAGHIDHGKTALIKCLTGCDTDRLKAEKERGMSIELGFAPCRISDMEIGIVDVPGHENFIKTMVAGASGIDGVIFVVAADDGVMPQTREHLDILTLLGVRYGLVALTKIDCVGSERLQTAVAEVRSFLGGTFLAEAEILAVSSVTGQGFDDFYESLKELVKAIEPKKVDGVFRLPIERAFSLKGYGTVVTGIPVSGAAGVGDEVVLLPQGLEGRIKAIQVYKRDSDTAMSGECAALNVPHWDYKTIRRGNVVTMGKYFWPQQWYLCELKVIGGDRLSLKNGSRLKFHTGTSEVLATVYLMQGDDIAGGQGCLAQVKLNEPVAAAPCDRFIVRTLSPAGTVGGGMIVEAIPGRLKRGRDDIIRDARARAEAVRSRDSFVEYCVRTAKGAAATEAELSLRAKVLPQPLRSVLRELVQDGRVLRLGTKLYIHSDVAVYAQQRLLEVVSDFHSSNPESPGVTKEQLYSKSGLEKDVFDGMIRVLISQGRLVERKHCMALPDYRETFDDEDRKLIETVESLFKRRCFNPPKSEEVVEQTGAEPEKVRKILRILTEQEHLVPVENDLLFHCDAIERARQILVSFISDEGRLESVKFKYLLDTTRKFAIPLLDYFDRIGVTRRVGNTRYLKKPVGSA